MRILIVEDEPLIALMLNVVLEDEGHEVSGPASTASEALALCEAALPDLALLDIDLREGLNGVTLAHVLFARWRLPVIFASGQLMAPRQARAVAIGYIRKPYEAETVLRSVELAREVLHGRRPETVPAGFELFSQAD
jgi:CheY-like chemotaxis protein